MILTYLLKENILNLPVYFFQSFTSDIDLDLAVNHLNKGWLEFS